LLLDGAAVTWPLAARAQQRRPARIGYKMGEGRVRLAHSNRQKTGPAGLGLFGRNRMRFHSQFSGNNIAADDHRLEVCGFAVPRLFRNRFLSGVTRTSTISPVTMYVP
jgi:hypothetical protein